MLFKKNSLTKFFSFPKYVLPLVEYANFLLYLNRNLDRDKLQRLQNRTLRLCFNIHDPRNITIQELHNNAKFLQLSDRRELQLLNIMYDLRMHDLYIKKKKAAVHTHQAEKICFNIQKVQYDIYKRLPYYIGVGLWNNLAMDVQRMDTK